MAGKVSSDPNIFILPDLGEGLEEAELIKWTVKEGDTVGELEIIAEMETDKALVEVFSFENLLFFIIFHTLPYHFSKVCFGH